MIYTVKIKEVNLCGCGVEGDMVIELLSNTFKVYYQAPDSFIQEFILNRNNFIKESDLKYTGVDNECIISVDLWLVYGKVKKVNKSERKFSNSCRVGGGLLKGDVISIFNDGDLRINCGIVIDITDDSGSVNAIEGDFVEIEGTYQVYFPETEFCK